MRRYFVMAVLAVCLLAPGLVREARAAEYITYPVDGTFYYRDVDGVRKVIPHASAILVCEEEGANKEPTYYGTIENGKLEISAASPIQYGKYGLTVSCYGQGPFNPLSCGSDVEQVNLQADMSLGEVEFTLHLSLPVMVTDPVSGSQLGEYSWTLLRGTETVETGTCPAVSSTKPDFGAYVSLHLNWGRHQLRLEKEGYQTAVYELCPEFDAYGNAGLVSGLNTEEFRLLPEGKQAQPFPTAVSYAHGVISWVPHFTTPEGPENQGVRRLCRLDFKNDDTGKEYNGLELSCTVSEGLPCTYDLFTGKPEWESGWYTVKITTLAWPYQLTMLDSETVIKHFRYEKPSRLPEVLNPRWVEKDGHPVMAWNYPSQMLGYVEKFDVIVRVSDTEDGWYRDFGYMADWEGDLTVAPSPDGIYEIPGLADAIKGYGEGWYVFFVDVVSGADEWRDSYGTSDGTVPFHYIPSPADPVKNGTMAAMDSVSGNITISPSVKWTLDNKSRTLTIRTTPTEDESLFVASYGEKGRFQGIRDIRRSGTVSLSGADSARMFWAARTSSTPLARAASIIS